MRAWTVRFKMLEKRGNEHKGCGYLAGYQFHNECEYSIGIFFREVYF